MSNSNPKNPVWQYFDPYNDSPILSQHEQDRRYRHHFDSGEASQSLITMINMAIAIRRPLFLTGPAGAGKSSIAKAVAAWKGWETFETVITSRSEADALKAEIDEVQRLADAAITKSAEQDLDLSKYLRPGMIWRAFNPLDAKEHWGSRAGQRPDSSLDRAATNGRVLLIDEIDKGDIDFANDLLDVLDEGSVHFSRTGITSRQSNPNELLVVITSNGERSFSEAFLRRCIVHRIDMPPLDAAPAIGRAVLETADRSLLDDQTLQDLGAMVKHKSRTDRLHVSYFADLVRAASDLLEGMPADERQEAMRVMKEFAAERSDRASRSSDS